MAEPSRTGGSRKLLLVLVLGLVGLAGIGLVGVLLFGEGEGKGKPPEYVLPLPPPPVIGSGEISDPHASAREGRDAGGDGELCLGCHADLETGSLVEPTVRATCEGCHLPDPDDPLAGHSHPLDVRVQPVMTALADPEPPLARGRMLTCTSCHDPHEARRPYLRGGSSSVTCPVCHAGH